MNYESKNLILDNLANSARAAGFLDETAYRNICLKIEFERESINKNANDLINEMAGKYFISPGQMKKICYPEGENKICVENILENIVIIKKPARRVHSRKRRL